MPKLKPGTIIPTPEEDAVINAGIAADPDTYELSDAEFAQLRRMDHPYTTTHLKVPTTISLDADVLAALKATGHDWQRHVNEVMREWLRTHFPA